MAHAQTAAAINDPPPRYHSKDQLDEILDALKGSRTSTDTQLVLHIQFVMHIHDDPDVVVNYQPAAAKAEVISRYQASKALLRQVPRERLSRLLDNRDLSLQDDIVF